jgi:hypothetical protein
MQQRTHKIIYGILYSIPLIVGIVILITKKDILSLLFVEVGIAGYFKTFMNNFVLKYSLIFLTVIIITVVICVTTLVFHCGR